MNRPSSDDSKSRVARHRAAMRAKGYRLRQFWLPDTRTEAFRERARRDALAIAAQLGRSDDIAFAEAVQYWPPEDED